MTGLPYDIEHNGSSNQDKAITASELLKASKAHRDFARYSELHLVAYLLDMVILELESIISKCCDLDGLESNKETAGEISSNLAN